MTVDAVSREADRIVARLTEGEAAWARQSLAQRRQLLDRMAALVDEHAAEWVEVARGIKGLAADSPLVGEEWISGPWALVAYLEALIESLARTERGENLLDGFDVDSAPGGRVAVKVLPHTLYDRLLLNGFKAEVWMQPGVTEQQMRSTVGQALKTPTETHGVSLVLGAGNIFSIAPLDTLYQLFAENRVVALKLNPITEPLEVVFGKVFAPLIELGAVEILTGGIEIGSALAAHDGVAAVHLTGSEATHDAVVWGPGEEGKANKAAGTPKLRKPMTSELGGVAPVIVVPGKWSKADLRFQARHVATQRLHNSGSNCIAAQMVVVSSDWPQKEAFLAELAKAFAEAPERPAWYPGSGDRVAAARSSHEGRAKATGGVAERTLLTGLDLTDPGETAFFTEYFAPVLGVTELPGSGPAFLGAAVEASNDTLHGTLGANIVIHPKTRKQMGSAFDELVADLRYGTVGINAWTGVGYLQAYATWGAFPGHPLDDVQSGIGVVHNALFLQDTERTVVEGPFRPSPRSILHGEWTISPKPPWFVDNRTAATTGRLLTHFARNPRVSALPAIFASALRG